MSRVPHGEPYAGKLHVRFDEGYPPKNGEVRFEGSRRPSGRSPRGVPLYSTPFLLSLQDEPTAALDEAEKRRLVDVLRATPATLLVATHDRAFAAALCPREIVASRL